MATKPTGGPGAAKDRAHEYVKRQVLTGAFPGGELISEGEVAAALGMSRTPVREAFLRLEAEGLLRLYPQRGALVVPVSSEEAVFERLSAELQRQRDAVAKSDLQAFADADRAFHSVTLQESGNSIVAGFYSSLRDRQTRMNRELVIHDERITTIMDEHRVIAEAVRDGDLQRTQEALRMHLASTMRTLGLAVEHQD
jgi:DNA-binding GntR family transcriptional regulator